MRTDEVVQHSPNSDGASARVRAAWRSAEPVTQRAFAAALVTAVAFGLSLRVEAPLRIAVAASGVCLSTSALVDIEERRLPNRLIGLAALLAVCGALLTGEPSRVTGAVVGALVAGGAMLLVRLIRGVGMGDVKMAFAIGLSVGPLGLFAAPLAIAVAALVAAAYGTAAHRARLALGPSLWFGWAVVVATAGRWG
jgi:leader peptidase (prepilin peptidase)/N-methyltransferase